MCIEDSPPVEKIVKKIDFKDQSMNGSGSPPSRSFAFIADRNSSELLSKQRNDSKQTLGGINSQTNTINKRAGCGTTNQNCSFYLTPSSGMQTPLNLGQRQKPGSYIVLNTEGCGSSASKNSSAFKIDNRRESGITAREGLSSKAADLSQGDQMIPFESTFSSQFKSQKPSLQSNYQPLKPLVQISEMLNPLPLSKAG